MTPILHSDEPPVYEIVNPSGPAPVLIACDHAQNRVPRALADLGLNERQLGLHIAYDIGAKEVALRLSGMFDAPLIMSGYSRLVVDMNRHLDDDSLIVEESDNIIVPGNRRLSQADREQRLDTFFHPYHAAYGKMVERLRARHESPFLISVHSFTPVFGGFRRPWDYGVLWDGSHERIARALLKGFSGMEGLVIGDNEPYCANEPRGYAQVVHAEQRGLEMAMLEIRQDLIDGADGQARAASVVYDVISPIVAARNGASGPDGPA